MDTLNAQAWVGREATAEGAVSAQLAAQINATMGEGLAPTHGAPLPPLWHWCAFPTGAGNDLLGVDGHVRGDNVLPPVPLPRRMWASGALRFHDAIRVGEPIERRSRVRSITDKSGAAGPMVFLTIDHTLSTARGLAIEERQDIVYLEIPDTFTPPAKKPLPEPAVEQVDTPETLLFRFSAITFNAHRIHYDLPYTQEVEKYPGLVVHGPLQAELLMRAAIRARGRTPRSFEFRGVHPMFAGTPCAVAMEQDGNAAKLCTGQDGHQCMTARAEWEETT